MGKIRLGVIGCGDIAAFMLFFAKMNRKIDIVGLTDINENKAKRYAKFFKGAKTFTDYNQMITDASVDAVYIALPHYLHYPVMKELIQKKIHILCEKPVTINVEHTHELSDLAIQNDVKVGINYQYRYDAKCYALKKAVENNEFNDIYYAVCNIAWYRTDRYFSHAPWHGDLEKSGGGTLLTQASHMIDYIIWLFDEKPEKVICHTTNFKFNDVQTEDTATGTIFFKSGRFFTITSSMVAKKEQPITLDLYCKSAQAKYIATIFPKLKAKGLKMKRYRHPAKKIHALATSLNAFCDWIQKDIPYLCSIQDAVIALFCVNKMYQSALTNEITEI